jgi:citrate lyase beta subunit/acyl dehydratase
MRSRLTSLCVPGTRADRQEKALRLPCDEVVLDLEDAVAIEDKDDARGTVVRTLANAGWASRTVAVRVNAGSRADLEAVAGAAGPEGLTVVLPKVERPEQVAAAAELLTATGIGLQALIETPAGSVAAHEIAVADESLVALLIGYADLGSELGRRGAERDPRRWLVHQERVLGAARTAGVQALDGPFLDVADEAGLRASARAARDLGFDGKWAIHPRQLEVIAGILSPTAAERAEAVAVERALSDSQGVVVLDGRMIDEAHRRQARRILALAGSEAAAPTHGRQTVVRRHPRTEAVAAPYADELQIGQVFDAPGLTLDAGLATLHRAACGDRLPLALDADLADRVTGTRHVLAHPAMVADVIIGQSTEPSGRVLGNLFYRGMALAPVRLGTTLSTRTEVVAIEPTRDGTRAKVTLHATTTDAAGKLVASYLRCPLLPAQDTVRPSGTVPDAPLDFAVPEWDLDPHPQGEPLVTGDRFDVESYETVTLAPELARATLNLAMTHTDAQAGSHGRRLVYGGHAIGIGLAYACRALPGLVTVLAWRSCDHLGPVFEEDRLTSRIEVLAVEGPIVDLQIVLSNADGDVLDWRPAVLYAS